MQYLTDPEAASLYEAWLARVAQAVRRAHAQANGRRDTDTADLASLRKDLASVNLHNLEIEEPDAAPGTPLAAAQKARRFLIFAENDHARGEHLAAILWLQQAYLSAHRALDLDLDQAASGPKANRGAKKADPAGAPETDPDQPPADLRPGSPGHGRWFRGIPKQRNPRESGQ